jgi:hypothetical protein
MHNDLNCAEQEEKNYSKRLVRESSAGSQSNLIESSHSRAISILSIVISFMKQ